MITDKCQKLFVQACCVICLLFFAGQAQAALMRSDVDPALYEEYALDPIFQSAGCLFVHRTGGWGHGTAALISPEWLITAAHVLDGAVDEVRFYTGASIYGGYDSMRYVDAYYLHPDYASGQTAVGVDLALVRLSAPITDLTPATLYSGMDERGTLMSMVGYGTPGNEKTGLGEHDWIKRAGNNIASNFGGDASYWAKIESQHWIAPFLYQRTDVQPLEWLATYGDSGGPWFAEIDGEMQLVGISTAWCGQLGYFGDAVALRTSLYTDWIYETMEANPAVPEPSTLVILATGMLFYPLVRKRLHRTTA